MSQDLVEDFTYNGYRNMTKRLQDAGYGFFPFTAEPRGKRVFMRHDVDLCLQKATELAELEASLNLTATYFFLVRTENYNLFSPKGTAHVSRILELGHHLGLHFDTAAYPADFNGSQLAKACAGEVNMLEDWFQKKVGIVSYHRPNKLVLGGDPALSAPLPHTYMARYTSHMHYVSDSRGAWGHGPPLATDAFRKGQPLHILIHPVWWRQEALSPQAALDRLMEHKIRDMEDAFAENVSIYRKPQRGPS